MNTDHQAIMAMAAQTGATLLNSGHAQPRTQPVASAPASSLDIDSSTLHRMSGSNEAGNIVPPVQTSHYHVLVDQSQTHPQGSPTVSAQRRSRRRRARLAAASRHSATQIRDDQQVLQFISGLKTLTEALGIFETTPLSRGQSRASAIGRVRRHHRHRSARPHTNRSNRRLQPLMSRVLTDSQPSNTTTRVVQNTDKLAVVARSYPRGTKYFFSLDGSPTN